MALAKSPFKVIQDIAERYVEIGRIAAHAHGAIHTRRQQIRGKLELPFVGFGSGAGLGNAETEAEDREDD